MTKPKKKEWIELIDEKLDELELRIEKLEKYSLQMNRLMSRDMIILASIASDYAQLSTGSRRKIESFDHYFGRIKERVKELEEVEAKIFIIPHIDLVNVIISLMEQNEIPFERLAPYIIKKLGKKLARKLVKKETMLEYYGKEGLKIWETLLKK